VQLHLSRQCNRPPLAEAAAHRVRSECRHDFRTFVALQDAALRVC
jgi:hypothetical protein